MSDNRDRKMFLKNPKLMPGKLYNFHHGHQDDFVAMFISSIKISSYFYSSKLLCKSQVLDICLEPFDIEEIKQKD